MAVVDEILKDLLVDQVKLRLFEEGIPRIKKCLAALNKEQIWHRPNENLVSVGNLTLHLCGNVRQWLIAGIGNRPDIRKREKEFNEKGPLEIEFLFQQLDDLQKDCEKVLSEIQIENLLEEKVIQGVFHETGVSILVHVMEHFSYHVGQITWYTKLTLNKDLQYYSHMDLEKPND
jgi:uncharacterized damage-inducible protein DinB